MEQIEPNPEVAKRNSARTHDTNTISFELEKGPIVAVEIASEVLGAEIWFAFREDFNPGDGKAIFFANELSMLQSKTPDQLRAIHQVKLKFGPRSRVQN